VIPLRLLGIGRRHRLACEAGARACRESREALDRGDYAAHLRWQRLADLRWKAADRLARSIPGSAS
jgi:hypothetical protein